jgi:hypothetical protein
MTVAHIATIPRKTADLVMPFNNSGNRTIAELRARPGKATNEVASLDSQPLKSKILYSTESPIHGSKETHEVLIRAIDRQVADRHVVAVEYPLEVCCPVSSYWSESRSVIPSRCGCRIDVVLQRVMSTAR